MVTGDNFLSKVGKMFLSFLSITGNIAIFFVRSVIYGFSPHFYGKQIFQQFIQFGYFSLPVVGLTAIFTGMAMALQVYSGFSSFSAENAIPGIVSLAMVRELGPVLTALMVAGRLGASMTAEIGTMKVTEQIDAITTLSVNPFKYLVFPRILSGILLMPFLVFIYDVIGIFGGYLVCVFSLHFNSSNYIFQTFNSIDTWDIVSGLIKGSCFGLIISLIGCYQGFLSRGGAEGVGRATTNSVVASSILVLLFDYILTLLFF